jgi:hypothetical protein
MSREPRMARAFVACALATLTRVAPLSAQEFEAAAPFGAATAGTSGAATAIDRGLPGTGRIELAASIVSRYAVPELTSQALVLGAGAGVVRGALGVAEFGPPDLGWAALAGAVGVCTPSGGAAVRGVVRRDQRGGSPVGLELGGGGWVRFEPLTVWASAPQSWTDGPAPPLSRPLTIGAAIDAGGARAWIDRVAAITADGDALAAGIAFVTPSACVWVGARDRPVRGSVGARVRWTLLTLESEVESHPVLAETVRVSVGIARRAAP